MRSRVRARGVAPRDDAQAPHPSGLPSPDQQQALAELALRHGIELIGPPLSEDIAAAA
jgi:hypothetical protein